MTCESNLFSCHLVFSRLFFCHSQQNVQCSLHTYCVRSMKEGDTIQNCCFVSTCCFFTVDATVKNTFLFKFQSYNITLIIHQTQHLIQMSIYAAGVGLLQKSLDAMPPLRCRRHAIISCVWRE